MQSFPKLPITALALAAGTAIAGSSSSSNSDINRAKNFQTLQQHIAPDPTDILANLDDYEKLWIEVPKRVTSAGKRGSCVWSECGIDETDDAYMGDNRDGDEKWYQYRTQGFCANAAYSLYGIKKGESRSFGSWGGCQRGHFINSFFTYGGADNLLKAIGVEPVIFYDAEDGDAANDDAVNDDAVNDDAANDDAANDDAANDDAANDDAANDDDNSNANCVEINYYDDEAQEDEQGDEDADARHRHLSGSGSQDKNDGYSSSLGCASDGTYIIASFQGNNCDGNYFLEDIDTFDDYNKQHTNVGCQRIYSSKDDEENSYQSSIYTLLSNSWTCDIRLYPDACPDPFNIKARYDYALRTAAHGGNPMRAYRNEVMRTPLRRVSWALLWLTALVLIATYAIKNKKRIVTHGGGPKGCLLCVKEDILSGWNSAKEGTMAVVTKSRAQLKKRINEKKRKKHTGQNTRSVEDASFKEIACISPTENDGSQDNEGVMT